MSNSNFVVQLVCDPADPSTCAKNIYAILKADLGLEFPDLGDAKQSVEVSIWHDNSQAGHRILIHVLDGVDSPLAAWQKVANVLPTNKQLQISVAKWKGIEPKTS